jgi:integrase
VPGLIIDITPNATRTFRVYKKIKGKSSPITVTLGKYPSLSIEQARNLATETIGRMSTGVNPNEVARSQRKSQITLQQAFDDYVNSRQLAEITVRDYKANIQNYLEKYLSKPLFDFTEDIVKREHQRVTKFSPSQADAIMRVVRAVFNFAKYEYRGIDNSFIFAMNPVEILSHHRLWNNVGRRNTRINVGQLPDWFKGLQSVREAGDHFTVAVCDLTEMALLTGLRKSELLGLRWEQVNFVEKTYFLSKTKNGEPLELPISRRVLEILRQRVNLSDPLGYVFNADNAYGVIREPKKAIAKIRAATSIDFSLHDLRRTFTTTAESINIGQYMIKRLLNHKSRRDDVTAGYVVLTPEELREPAQRIEDKILEQAGLLENTGKIDNELINALAELSDEKKKELIEKLQKGIS